MALDVGVRLPRLNDTDELVTALHPATLVGLMDELGPSPIAEIDGQLELVSSSTAERLMAELCWNSGLRRSEVCKLDPATVLSISTRGRDPLSTVALRVVGKGSRARKVPVPVWLLEAIKLYAEGERAKMIEKRGVGESYLFVVSSNNTAQRGLSITAQTFNRKFAKARTRLLNRLAKECPSSYETSSRERITVHSLRHTFALFTYIARRNAGDPDPIKYVQSVLGHAMRQTTEAIYLRSAQVYESEIVDAIGRRIELLP